MHFQCIVVELGDKTWSAIEIDESGWKKINDPPIRFLRTGGMTPLPDPITDGSDEKTLEVLRSFLNLKSDDDFVLVVFWLLAALRPKGPYPVLVLSGEQGTAKSTFTKIMRALIDPNKAPLRSLPRKDEDLIIAAHNSHALVFDNVSGFSGDISDALCRIATGSGHGKRKLYTDNTEVIFDGSRPIILNGITEFVTRSDLADRSITVTLESIPPEKRRLEKELWEAFDEEKPRILGALLNAMVVGLDRFPNIWMEKLPRMADFAKWSIACETAFWPEGTYERVSKDNHSRSRQMVLDNDVVAVALVNMLEQNNGSWSGSPTQLLSALEFAMSGETPRLQTWPKGPPRLTNRLNRLKPILREIGITIERDRKGHGGAREISITRTKPSATKADSSNESLADSADSENEQPFRLPKKGISPTSPFPGSQGVEETPSAPSASSKPKDKQLINKWKNPVWMLTVPLTVDPMLTVPLSAKAENGTKSADFDAENRDADGKTGIADSEMGVADGVLTVTTVSNQDRFYDEDRCSDCNHYIPHKSHPHLGHCAGGQTNSPTEREGGARDCAMWTSRPR